MVTEFSGRRESKDVTKSNHDGEMPAVVNGQGTRLTLDRRVRALHAR